MLAGDRPLLPYPGYSEIIHLVDSLPAIVISDDEEEEWQSFPAPEFRPIVSLEADPSSKQSSEQSTCTSKDIIQSSPDKTVWRQYWPPSISLAVPTMGPLHDALEWLVEQQQPSQLWDLTECNRWRRAGLKYCNDYSLDSSTTMGGLEQEEEADSDLPGHHMPTHRVDLRLR
jgi:hypothetical protein